MCKILYLRKKVDNLKSDPCLLLLLCGHRQWESQKQRRNPLTGELVACTCSRRLICPSQPSSPTVCTSFCTWETDYTFIAYPHSWGAKAADKQNPLWSTWQCSEMETIRREGSSKPLGQHHPASLPLRTSASHPCPWDEQISSRYWSLLVQACLAESQGSSGWALEE